MDFLRGFTPAQVFGQRQSRPSQVGLDGVDRHSHGPGNVLRTQSFQGEQHQYFALFVRQAGDTGFQPAKRGLLFEHLLSSLVVMDGFLVFGDGAIEHLGNLAAELGATRVMIISDPGVTHAGHTARGLAIVQAAGLTATTFASVHENPSATLYFNHQTHCTSNILIKKVFLCFYYKIFLI